jgi:hypothetical protein
MSDDFYLVHGKDGKLIAAFSKSKVSSVTYGFCLELACYGCYVNGTSIFIPNIDVETFIKTFLGKPKMRSQVSH